MEENKVLENITKSISNKLKVPIIVTYLSVLIIYNWDILFYLFFENTSASMKIEQIKLDYSDLYFERIAICLLISVILIILFTVLNTSINFCLKWFYRKDKEISSQIDDFENIKALTEQLSQSIETTKSLESQIQDLRNVNQNLSSKNLDIKISDISKKDYNTLLSYINSQQNKEKLLFSLKELMDKLKENIEIGVYEVKSSATYQEDMNELISLLERFNLLKPEEIWINDNRSTYIFKISPSFNDFLKMNI